MTSTPYRNSTLYRNHRLYRGTYTAAAGGGPGTGGGGGPDPRRHHIPRQRGRVKKKREDERDDALIAQPVDVPVVQPVAEAAAPVAPAPLTAAEVAGLIAGQALLVLPPPSAAPVEAPLDPAEAAIRQAARAEIEAMVAEQMAFAQAERDRLAAFQARLRQDDEDIVRLVELLELV